jgi:hypothetical protein
MYEDRVVLADGTVQPLTNSCLGNATANKYFSTPHTTHHTTPHTTHHTPHTTHHTPRTTHHAPRTTHHAPRTTHHAPRTTHHAPRTTHHTPTTVNVVLTFDLVNEKPMGGTNMSTTTPRPPRWISSMAIGLVC